MRVGPYRRASVYVACLGLDIGMTLVRVPVHRPFGASEKPA